MSYNIVKTMIDPRTGKKTCVLMLDGLSSILEIGKLEKALKMAEIFNRNSDSGWVYEVRGGGKTINKK
jgi:hypothetical protein